MSQTGAGHEQQHSAAAATVLVTIAGLLTDGLGTMLKNFLVHSQAKHMVKQTHVHTNVQPGLALTSK